MTDNHIATVPINFRYMLVQIIEINLGSYRLVLFLHNIIPKGSSLGLGTTKNCCHVYIHESHILSVIL